VSATTVTVIAILLFTSLILLVMVIALARHTKVLARSVAEFQAAVQPELDEIQRGTAEAERLTQRIQERSASMASGARIRR
jgi:F0F1-type ATP synthase membrane subunit b/b'